jgi:phenylacetate-CoA ligase
VPRVLQAYASADIGSIAYETRSGEARCRHGAGRRRDPGNRPPGSGDPVPAGEVGEVVVTVFNPDYPLIRFATGDLSAILTDAPPSACGRTNTRIKGWLGRADQTTKVRGMFVHPSQVHDRAPPSGDRQGAAGGVGQMAQEAMTLHCEVADPPAPAARAIVDHPRADQAARRGAVCGRGSLPNDGKVIADVRDYQ